MITSPGRMKQAPPSSAPRVPRSRHAQKIASCVDVGPGSRLVAAMPSSNSSGRSQCRSSTHIRRSSAMCAGGPPKPVTPMRDHSRAITGRLTRAGPGSATGSVI